MPKYKITGIDVRGKRFRIFTNSSIHALGINLWNGTVWERNGDSWKVIKRVWN